MPTDSSVLDGKRKLSDEEIGRLHRRLTELIKRIDSGNISAEEVFQGLQAIIEGKAKDIGKRCKRDHRAPKMELKRLPVSERKKSLTPLRLRLQHSLNRLYFEYKYRLQMGSWPWGHPGRPNHLTPEDIVALMWEAENIPRGSTRPIVWGIFEGEEPSERDFAVVSSTLQWLFTNNGKEFLRRVVATADINMS